MSKVLIAFIMIGGIISDTCAMVNFGLRGGYAYESSSAKEVYRITKITTGSTTIITDTTYTPEGEEAETKHPKGFGGELLCEIIPPLIPIGIELSAGSYTTSFTDVDNSTEYTYTINSLKFSTVGKYFIRGIPIVSPWIGVGPFIGLNTHKSKSEDLNITFEGERTTNFGILGGVGANIGLVPNLSVNPGFIFDYFIVSKGKFIQTRKFGTTTTETTSEVKYSQWNIVFSLGITYRIM